MKLPLFDLAPQAQRRWLAERLSRPAPASARNLSDGYRLPGREGEPTPAAVLVPFVTRPDGLAVLFTEIRRDYFAIPYRERYIWGATAAMLMILDRTLRGEHA